MRVQEFTPLRTLCSSLLLIALTAAAAPGQSAYQEAVENDWAVQERRLGRAAGDPLAIQEALKRLNPLVADLDTRTLLGAISEPHLQIASWRDRSANLDSLDTSARLALYHEIRWFTRNLALKNPLIADKPIAFMKRNRFICQMLHEYLGYFYDYGNVSGGGVFVLEEPGISFRTRDLVAGRLPRGSFATMALSFDARRIYFAFAERSEKKPDFFSADRRSFHILFFDLETGELTQLTRGPEDDFDPCPLPDGGIAFISSRRGAFCRCNNPWEPIPTYTLHRMNADGTELRTLSFHETNEWHPFVLNDGRIVYTRWDYVDRSAANFHGLWITNPDGSNPVSLFGNYTTRINACYQPRSIPASDRILFVAGAHHADVGGSLVLLDPRRVALDPKTGEDDLNAIELLTPEICFAESDGWPKSYFHSPWPLSENYFISAFSFDPLPGMSTGENSDTHTGLYYFDRWGNFELLYRDPDTSSMYPIPLAPRPRPPVVASTRHPELGEEGEFVLGDVRRSLLPWPENRPVVELRIFQVLPKTESHIVNEPRIGYANAESARMLLGTAPVEQDGSAYFRAPARKPLYFQAVDAQGRAVQSMRSVTYLQPGERRSCIGCHEGPNATPSSGISLAARREASILQPGPEGSHPLSFPLLVQPVLDRHCARCHNEQDGAAKPALTGRPGRQFNQSYENLRPFVRWYEWGGDSISQITTHPGEIGADMSKLTQVLEDSIHASVAIPEQDLRRIYLWLDANAPFYGTYEKSARIAQREGKPVPPPDLQ